MIFAALTQFIPGKAWLAIALVAAVVAGALWLRYDAVRDERQKNRETQVEREKDISDAINSCADLHWTKRLLCTDE